MRLSMFFCFFTLFALVDAADTAWAQTFSTQAGALTTVSPGMPHPTGPLSAWALLTATAGLIAFHIGLFTLVGRERKSPYIINFVYPIFLLCLVVATTALSTVLLPAWLEQRVLQASALLLILSFIISIAKVYRITIRSVYFVDSIKWEHLPGIRSFLRRKNLISPRPNYAHNTLPISAELKKEIIGILVDAGGKNFENRQELEPQSLALAVQHQGQANALLARLGEKFLEQGFTVQYLTASRHPIEFLKYLKRHMEEHDLEWSKYTNHIVVIDAYSPHFAFLDSIYPKKDVEIESLDITRIKSKITYAGMHTASSKAFKVLKEQINDRDRLPTLVIYEDCYALSDLESPEQYRIFLRHVIPSERIWGGMFTVFLEFAMPDADWRILQGYASMRLDLCCRTATAESKSISSPDRAIPDQHSQNDTSTAPTATNVSAKEPPP